MKAHAPNGQRTLFDMGCTKRKRLEGEEAPRELRPRLNPELATRLKERDTQVAAAVASRPPPPPPRPGSRPRILPVVQAPPPPVVIWVQLVPIKLPGQQEGLSLRLHEYQAATAASKVEQAAAGVGAAGCARLQGLQGGAHSEDITISPAEALE